MAEPLATQFYLPSDASNDDIREAGQLAMQNYETLNTGDKPLQPAGVYVGKPETDDPWWIPAGEAATWTG
jgi:hypothetical protein